MKRTLFIAMTCTAVWGQSAWAAEDVTEANYTCERGVEIPVTYVNGVVPALAVLNIEGKQVTLQEGPSASGAKYGPANGGTGYIWFTKGSEATLSWQDASYDAATPLLSNCKIAEG